MAITRTRVSLEGIPELNKAAEQLKKNLFEVLGDCVRAGSDIIRDDAKKRAPEDTGALKDGIVSTVTWEREGAPVDFAGAGMDAKMNDVFVKFAKHEKVFRKFHGYDRKIADPRWEAKRYYYPASIEYGHKGAPAHPFMRPAMEKNKGAVRKAIRARVKQVIDGVKSL